MGIHGGNLNVRRGGVQYHIRRRISTGTDQPVRRNIGDCISMAGKAQEPVSCGDRHLRSGLHITPRHRFNGMMFHPSDQSVVSMNIQSTCSALVLCIGFQLFALQAVAQVAPPVKSVVKVQKAHFSWLGLGKDIERHNKDIQQLMGVARSMEKGSVSRKMIERSSKEKRQDRAKLVKRRDRFSYGSIVMHGRTAVNDQRASIMHGLNWLLKSYPHGFDLTGYVLHVWYASAKKKWSASLSPPLMSEFLRLCANQKKATCYKKSGGGWAEECVCADGSKPEYR